MITTLRTATKSRMTWHDISVIPEDDVRTCLLHGTAVYKLIRNDDTWVYLIGDKRTALQYAAEFDMLPAHTKCDGSELVIKWMIFTKH